MSLDYDIIQAQEESSPQTSMSSYSDLFAALGFVFLFLYVMSTLQSNLQSIASVMKIEDMQSKIESYELPPDSPPQQADLSKPVNYANILKKLAHLENQTRTEAQKFYEQVETFKAHEAELLDKYQSVVDYVRKENQTLASAVREKDNLLETQRAEFERKLNEKEINLAQTRQDLDERSRRLDELTTDYYNVKALNLEMKNKFSANSDRLSQLEQEVAQKELERQQLAASKKDFESRLAQSTAKISDLEQTYKETAAQKEAAAAENKKLKDQYQESVARLEQLEQAKDADRQQLAQLKSDKKKLGKALSKSEKELQQYAQKAELAEAQKDKLAADRNKLLGDLNETKAQLGSLAAGKAMAMAEKKQLASLQKQLQGDLNKTKAKLAELANDRMTAKAEKDKLNDAYDKMTDDLADARDKIADLQRRNADAEDEKAGLLTARNDLLNDYNDIKDKLDTLKKDKDVGDQEKKNLLAEKKKLEDDLADNMDKLDDLEKEKAQSDTQNEKLIADLGDLEDKLADYRAKEKLKKNIIDNLKSNFDKHNIKADIDESTGEVTLPFDEAHFDLDSSKLRSEMKVYLNKIIPVYADSIFGADTIYKFIHSIEIVGYASPIFDGKYVDPHDLSEKNQQALHYNMNLSYRRAHAIFKHILNKHNLNYPHQKDLALYLKVTGRSYLENQPVKELISGETQVDEFCSQYDCEKLQSAAIRFNLVK